MPLIPSYTGFASTPDTAGAWLGGRRQLLAEREQSQQAAAESERIALGYAQLRNQREMAQMEFAAKAEAQAKENLLRQQELEIRKAYNEQMLGLREQDLMRKLEEAENRRAQSEAMMAFREAGMGLREQEMGLKGEAMGLREREASLREQALGVQQENLKLSQEKFAAAEPTRIATESRKEIRDELSRLRDLESKAFGRYSTIANDVLKGETDEYEDLNPFMRGEVDKVINWRKQIKELEDRLAAITEAQARPFIPAGMGTSNPTTNALPRILRKTPR